MYLSCEVHTQGSININFNNLGYKLVCGKFLTKLLTKFGILFLNMNV